MHGSWRTGGILINGGGYDNTDQFTGISFYPETGTFSELQIYGYAMSTLNVDNINKYTINGKIMLVTI